MRSDAGVKGGKEGDESRGGQEGIDKNKKTLGRGEKIHTDVRSGGGGRG